MRCGEQIRDEISGTAAPAMRLAMACWRRWAYLRSSRNPRARQRPAGWIPCKWRIQHAGCPSGADHAGRSPRIRGIPAVARRASCWSLPGPGMQLLRGKPCRPSADEAVRRRSAARLRCSSGLVGMTNRCAAGLPRTPNWSWKSWTAQALQAGGRRARTSGGQRAADQHDRRGLGAIGVWTCSVLRAQGGYAGLRQFVLELRAYCRHVRDAGTSSGRCPCWVCARS